MHKEKVVSTILSTKCIIWNAFDILTYVSSFNFIEYCTCHINSDNSTSTIKKIVVKNYWHIISI